MYPHSHRMLPNRLPQLLSAGILVIHLGRPQLVLPYRCRQLCSGTTQDHQTHHQVLPRLWDLLDLEVLLRLDLWVQWNLCFQWIQYIL